MSLSSQEAIIMLAHEHAARELENLSLAEAQAYAYEYLVSLHLGRLLSAEPPVASLNSGVFHVNCHL